MNIVQKETKIQSEEHPDGTLHQFDFTSKYHYHFKVRTSLKQSREKSERPFYPLALCLKSNYDQ